MGDEKGECEYNKQLDILLMQPGDFHPPASFHSKKFSALPCLPGVADSGFNVGNFWRLRVELTMSEANPVSLH